MTRFSLSSYTLNIMKKIYFSIFAIILILSIFSQKNQGIIRKSIIQSSEYFERFSISFNSKENIILSEEIILETSKQIKISGYCDIANENTVDIYYRIYTKNWNRWVKLKSSPHQESQIKNRIFYQGRNEFGNIKKIQFKIDNSKNNGNCTFKVFFPLKTLNTKTTYRKNLSNKNDSACPQPNYLSRDSWCLDNDCQNNNPMSTTPTHIAIHHSAGLDISPPYSAEVFSIWDDHVNDRGWDDIGYNWLISPDGQIFEGRGDGILGANFSCMNTGITGICLLGNFEFYTLNSPTGEAVNSLVEIARWEAVDKNIIIDGGSFHNSSNLFLDHLIGHNDSNSSVNSCNMTQCPGDNLSLIIPSIKKIISASSCYQDYFNQCNDNYEPNNSQSQSTQLYQFGLNSSQSDSFNECIDQAKADIDWYRMNLTHQGELTITLSSQQISSLYMDWLDNGNVTSSTTVNGDKQIVICSNNGPACYDTALRVYTVTQNGNDPIPYTLDIQWSANQSCTSGRQSSTNNSSQNNSTITINGSTNVCEGLSNNLSISGASGSFDWFVNGQSVHIGNTFNTQSLNAGQYDLFVISTDDVCSFAEVQLNITSGVTANAGSNVTIQNGGSTTLQDSGSTNCSWSPTTGLSNPNSCTTTASPTQTTTYTLTVTENGCTDTDTVTVTVDGSGGGNPPANDDCSDAITLTSSTSCNYTTGTVEDATPSFGANNCLGCSCTSPDDYDVYYKFTAVETSHTVTVSNYVSNFDAVIELRTACSSGSSNYISCYDPTGAPTSVSETWTGLTIGQTYYIRVFEWGYQQSPSNADTFDICVTHQSSNTNGIDLISDITSVSNDNPDVGNQITVNYSVTNNGDETMTTNTTSALYLSTNQTYDSSDILITGSVYALTTNLSPNQSINLSPTVTLPNISDGQYYIISYPDLPELIDESDNDNNTDAYAIQIGDIVQNGPDLDVTRVRTVPDTGLVPGQEVEIEIRIENEGNEDSSSFDVLVYLDIDGDDEYDSNEFMGEFTFNSLDAGENDTLFVDFDLPVNIPSSGVYELFAVADSNNDINETDEGNNDKDDNITIALANGGAEDVALLNESVNITTVNAGGTVDVVVNHVYLGSQTTDDLPTLNLAYYLSTDCNFSVAEDTYLDGDISNLGINNPNVEEDETLTIPASTPSGVYYILFIADSDNEVEEGTLENNNVECIQITVNGSITPDGDIYITDEVCNPTDVIMGSEIEPFANIHYTGGQTNADLPSIEVFYFLSNDCTLSNDDLLISDDSISLGSDLPVNDASDVIELPSNLSPGTYYIIFRADVENVVYETNENNNIACAQFNLLPADANYQDVTFNSPYVAVTEATFGDQVYASIHQNYTGYQADADIASIRMEYYLSTDCTLSADDYYFTTDVSSLGYDDPSQFEFATLTIPTTISAGDYYVLFVADTEDIIAENNEGNNTACVPITISETLGIDDNELTNKIKVYPNPVNDTLTINLGEVHSKINLEIFNVIGQKIHSLEFEQKQMLSINIHSLSNGIYFFKIKTDSIKSAEFKIIKE